MKNKKEQESNAEEHRLASHWSLYFFESLDEQLERINATSTDA